MKGVRRLRRDVLREELLEYEVEALVLQECLRPFSSRLFYLYGFVLAICRRKFLSL